jgi:hypothetical protein
MFNAPFADRNFMQFCWLVPDLEAGMAAWTQHAGIGPFFRFDDVAYEQPRYRGKPGGNASITAAIAQAGEVQIELVCVKDKVPSIWQEGPCAGTGGFHHAAIYCENYDQTIEQYTKAGTEFIFDGLMVGSRVGWLDTTRTLGFFVEVIDANPVAAGIFQRFRDAARDWDGSDPVRRL